MAARIKGTFMLQISYEGGRKLLLSCEGIIAAKFQSGMCVATVKAMLNVWAEYALLQT